MSEVKLGMMEKFWGEKVIVPRITLIYSYYENPEMFRVHQAEWMNYPKNLLNQMYFIVTDDCSVNHPLKDNIVVPKDFPLLAFRITKKVPWNWRACRNIGVYNSAPGGWLLITDIDHLVPCKTIEVLFRLINGKMSINHFYTFNRKIAPDLKPYKNHPNTYFLHRSLYLTVGGYDECVSGIYGLDGVFRRQLERNSRGAVQLKVDIHLYQRDFVADASLPDSVMTRKENRDIDEVHNGRELMKQRVIKGIRPDVCTFSYERIW